MGLIDRLLRGGKKEEAMEATETRSGNGGAGPLREGVPVGLNQAEPVLTITETAREKVRAVLEAQTPPARTIRVSAPARGRYAMNLEPEGKPDIDDTVLPYDGFEVFVDPHSLALVQGATLSYVETANGAGFQFDNPRDTAGAPKAKEPPAGPEGDVWRQILEVLEEQINPMVASHGGQIRLMEYKDGIAFVQMAGGCQGCGMASVTLKQGVERMLKDEVPEVEEIIDITDHAGGRNPYYAGAGA